MDTRLLRSFVAVARASSFTDAALELGYTQSTVTGHVQKLERQLGVRLLDRLPGGVRVTDAGARLIPDAEEILATEERLTTVSRQGRGELAGTVRVMAPESLCTYRLPAVVSALRDTAPSVDVWLTPGGIDQTLDAVKRGNVDLALTMEPRPPVSELEAERLGNEPLVLVTSAAERPGARLSWADLARRDALLIEEGCGYSDDVAARLSGTGQPTGRRSHFGSIEAIKRCVAVGLGWTALPAIAASDQIESGALRLLEGPPLPDCEVHTLTHPRRYRSPAVAVVLDQLRQTWNPRSR